jgi:hypothetical protein
LAPPISDSPISQVYDVMADNAIPYNVMGNIQEKSSFGGPSPASGSGGPQTVLRARHPILLVTDLAEHYAKISGHADSRLGASVTPSQPRR